MNDDIRCYYLEASDDGVIKDVIKLQVQLKAERGRFFRQDVLPELKQDTASGAVMGHVAAYDGKLGGFVLYKPLSGDKHEIVVRKLEVAPDAEGCGVREALIETMMEKLRPDCAHRMEFRVHVDDVELQRALAQAGFKPRQTDAIQKEGAETFVVLEKFARGKGVKITAPSAILRHDERPKDRKELLERMMLQMRDMTRLTWTAAMPDDAGVLCPVKVSYLNCDDERLRLMTTRPVVNPDAALAALSAYFGVSTKGRGVSIGRSSPVVVPAEWVRNVHLKQDQEGRYFDAFATERSPESPGRPPEGFGAR